MKDFKLERHHYGKLKMNTEDHGFNTIVISGPCMGGLADTHMVGRLLQVRKKSGAFGTDTIIIQNADGGLQSFHNQSFYSVSEENKEFFEEMFKETEIHEPNIEYTIQGKHKATGFVVEGMDCTDGEVYSFVVSKKGNKTTIHC